MTQRLIVDLRSRARFHSGYDWKIMRDAASALENQGEAGPQLITPESIIAYLTERDISLLPWQKKKLLASASEVEREGVPT